MLLDHMGNFFSEPIDFDKNIIVEFTPSFFVHDEGSILNGAIYNGKISNKQIRIFFESLFKKYKNRLLPKHSKLLRVTSKKQRVTLTIKVNAKMSIEYWVKSIKNFEGNLHEGLTKLLQAGNPPSYITKTANRKKVAVGVGYSFWKLSKFVAYQ